MKRRINGFNLINGTLLSLMSLLFIIPFIFLINQSFMSNEAILKYGYTLFPREIALYSYKYLLVENVFIYKGLAISVLVTLVGTFFCLLFTCTMAYGLSKKYLPYRSVLTMAVLITMFFSGGLIPSYLLVTNIGLRDSLWALILPALISPWYMFLMRNFFMDIPQEVEESAQMDGANEIGILIKIIVPMSLPSMATIGLFYAVGHWNSWFSAAIYLSTQDKWPLQLILRGMLANLDLAALGKNPAMAFEWMKNMPKEGVKAAATLLTALPIVCVYPFIQKYFVKGMLVGSVKG
ncbi:carbohydrate ABC transporter permease [Paenibacillus eucommiae]|uniref:Aldouronate transport system permease protein n=1 Tax=Paenibacillus eucommiae TaxID=1355755 RepID=A0ABS4JB17_9BACL|nr:carbohydrate ABC transporter permease [Paenibacillus eucommiae]MBP1997005.1 putative aldouronate transport system permease protein [Paenibacillus eucommiae]